jgi:hypothetical protein
VAALFHASSVGCVTGVELSDERRVVIKAHQPDREFAFLREVARVQAHLADRGVPAPRVVAGPHPLGHGHAIVEAFVDAGRIENAHRDDIRRALATQLRAIAHAGEEILPTSTLPLQEERPKDLWPVPHSKLFDFEATAHGAEHIDALAESAREVLASVAEVGDVVLAHNDLRAEHVRFEGTRPVAIFDWDSLRKRREPALVGAIAHAFAADWSTPDGPPPAPTLDEARAFVADYEHARGRAFDEGERRLIGAAFAYSCAYTARCGHALGTGTDERDRPGTFMHLVWHERERLLTL